MVGHRSFKQPTAPRPVPRLVKQPRMDRSSASQPTSQVTSARGFIPPSGAVNGRPLGSGAGILGFPPPGRSISNPGRPLSRSHNGSGNIVSRPFSAQQYSSYSQPRHDFRIQTLDPDQTMEMHSQPYQQFQGNDHFNFQYHSQPTQLGDWNLPQSRQSLHAPVMDQMSHSTTAADIGLLRNVHGANSAQALPPQRPPMHEFFREARKQAAALEAEDGSTANSSTVKDLGSSLDKDPLEQADVRTQAQKPVQRPARSLYQPRDDTEASKSPAPHPQKTLQDKAEILETRSTVEDEHDGRVTRSSRCNGKASTATSSLSAPNGEVATQQSQQLGQSKRSVATATDANLEQLPRKKLRVVTKKYFQQSLKADDLMSATLKNGLMNDVALPAVMLGGLMVHDEEFSKMVGSVLKNIH
ncbi:uncharacterized protein PG998_013500 [Apiospora kogelbergensis]|uniref:uncharacterized protein n=1 Tax=Apiospora kogelbergensis TaxID=1337665 RepID=UPI0031315D79